MAKPRNMNIRIVESYWARYFQQLDKLAPHPTGCRAHILTNARAVTCYACKDGLLCSFDEGASLAFTHQSSGLRVETMFKKLTAPLTISFRDRFPDTLDFGPLNMAEVSPGETVTFPVYFYRAVWDQRGGFQTSKSPQERASNDHKQEQKQQSLWSMSAEKARRSLKRQ